MGFAPRLMEGVGIWVETNSPLFPPFVFGGGPTGTSLAGVLVVLDQSRGGDGLCRACCSHWVQ